MSHKHCLNPKIVANLYRSLAISKLTYGLELLNSEDTIETKQDQRENGFKWLDNTSNKSLIKIFGCRLSTKQETIKNLLGLQSISSHAKSLQHQPC